MARIFDEKLEGAGYEEAGANEAVGAGCTIDEDADSADVSSPSGWDSQCLKFISLAGISNKVDWYEFGPEAIIYYRIEFVITAESLANTQKNEVLALYDSGWAYAFEIRLYQDGSGNLKFRMGSYHDGNIHYYYSFPNLSLNTRYRVEIKWDATNNLWAWKIDGVNQPNDQDASDPVTTEGNLTGTHAINCDQITIGGYATVNMTIYCDLIAIDDADWVGAESGNAPTGILHGPLIGPFGGPI